MMKFNQENNNKGETHENLSSSGIRTGLRHINSLLLLQHVLKYYFLSNIEQY